MAVAERRGQEPSSHPQTNKGSSSRLGRAEDPFVEAASRIELE